MNRRQAKKAYKKKYGYNPPKTEIRYHQKWYARKLTQGMVNVQKTIQDAIRVLRTAFETISSRIEGFYERVQTMSERELYEFMDEHPELTPKDRSIIMTIKRKGSKS